MENKYIYIDESGDTGYTNKSTRYFILTSVTVSDEIILRRIAKRDTRSSYNLKIINIFNKINIKSNFSDPNTEKALQIADFYSWVIFSHLEHNFSEYFLKLKHQIDIIYTKQSPRGTCDLSYDSSPSRV